MVFDAGTAIPAIRSQELNDVCVDTDISVINYTDSIGNDEYNQALSERSAASMYSWMQPARKRGLSWRGEQNPIATNETAQPAR